MRKAIAHVVVTTTLLSFGGVAAADEAQRAFDRLFGQKIKAARATRTAEDDAALAKELLTTAKMLTGEQGLLALLCREAYSLGGQDAAGYDTAIAAMELLAAHVPAAAGEARRNITELLRAAYGRSRGDDRAAYGRRLAAELVRQGDELVAAAQALEGIKLYRQALTVALAVKSDLAQRIKAKLDHAAEMARVERRVEQLEAQLAKAPTDAAAAGELIVIYIAKYDRPADAAQYADAALGDLERRARLAPQPIGAYSPDDALDMAHWYADLAAPEPDAGKAVLLDKAVRCYDRFLDAYDKTDLKRTTAALERKRLEEQLETLIEAAGALAQFDARWKPLFHSPGQLLADSPNLPPTNGTLKYADGVLTSAGFARVAFPVTAKNVLVRVKVKTTATGMPSINLRSGKDGQYIMRWFGDDRFAVYATVAGQGRQLVQVQRKVEFDEYLEWTVGVLGDTLVMYAAGQEVLRLKNDALADPGEIAIYGMGEGASFKDAAYLLPTDAQVLDLLAADAQRRGE